MKTKLRDALQIFVAVLFTGSTAFAMQPTAIETSETQVAEVQQVESKIAEKPQEKPAKASKPKKAVTWRDNPQKCNQRTQYIAKERPFKCIDKQNVPTENVAPAAARSVSISGSCGDWIKAAGIGDVANANELIRRESGCNPNAVNPSSGACGVAQELPCGKSGCSLGDGACQVKWMNGYVLGRYGSWANAVSFHNANNWY